MKKNKRIYKSILVVIVIILVWYLISKAGIFSSFVFPSPIKVFNTFISMLKSGELLRNSFASLYRVLLGFIISFVLAFVLGILTCLYPKAEPYYEPILEFLRHVPPMSLIPLLILWSGIGETSKIIVIVLTSFFPIFMNTRSGLINADEKLIEVGKMLNMSKTKIFFSIRLPYALPNILIGARIGLGYSLRAIIGAEMIAAASGLGYMILDAQSLSRIDKVIVGIIMIGILGLLIDSLFNYVIKKFVTWKEVTDV